MIQYFGYFYLQKGKLKGHRTHKSHLTCDSFMSRREEKESFTSTFTSNLNVSWINYLVKFLERKNKVTFKLRLHKSLRFKIKRIKRETGVRLTPHWKRN